MKLLMQSGLVIMKRFKDLKYKIPGNQLVTFPIKHRYPIYSFYLSLFLLFSSLILTITNLLNTIVYGGNNWGIGEWLINYNGGLVRRGLVGQIILASQLNGTSLISLIVSIQISLYLVVWIYLMKILIKNNFSWPFVALICNPLGICFIGWDQFVLIRKEFIGLASMIVLSLYIRGKPSHKGFLILFYILFTLAIFSSEVNLVLLPGIVFLLRYESDSRWMKFFSKEIFLLGFLVCSSILTSFFFKGDKNIAQSVCKKIIDSGLDPEKNCRGAVDVLGMSFSSMLSTLSSSYPAYLFYFVFLLLAVMPFSIISSDKLNGLWILAIFAGTLPLYFIAWDYGRWIFIFIVEITICLSITEVRVRNNSMFNSRSTSIYLLLWGSGHGGNPLENGWIGAMPTLIRKFFGFFN
jgi:hypothetical protein